MGEISDVAEGMNRCLRWQLLSVLIGQFIKLLVEKKQPKLPLTEEKKAPLKNLQPL